MSQDICQNDRDQNYEGYAISTGSQVSIISLGQARELGGIIREVPGLRLRVV